MTAGNVTEQGLFKFLMSEIGPQGILDLKSSVDPQNILCKVPFTSYRKFGSTVIRNPDKRGTDREVRVYCKGAPDMLWDITEKIVTPDGQEVDINNETDVPEELLEEDEK